MNKWLNARQTIGFSFICKFHSINFEFAFAVASVSDLSPFECCCWGESEERSPFHYWVLKARSCLTHQWTKSLFFLCTFGFFPIYTFINSKWVFTKWEKPFIYAWQTIQNIYANSLFAFIFSENKMWIKRNCIKWGINF